MNTVTIALIGDYNESVVAHICIPKVLESSCKALGLTSGIDINWEWIKTSDIHNPETSLSKFSALWITPGSPYENMEGVLKAIRFARETQRYFLGTCGGFQHALIEIARTICKEQDADHAETNPNGSNLVVLPLSCSLVGKKGEISFIPESYLDRIFKGQSVIENFNCNYGINAEWRGKLEAAGLKFSGFDVEGKIRAFELPTHPFFIGTLFQPERYALEEKEHPLITAFVKECMSRKMTS